MVASLIAEPSVPERVVPMLDVFPPHLIEFYADEEKVLEGGGTDPDEQAVCRRLAQVIGGQRK